MTPKQLDKVRVYKNSCCFESEKQQCSTVFYYYILCKKNNLKPFVVIACNQHVLFYKKHGVISRLDEKDIFYLRINGKME